MNDQSIEVVNHILNKNRAAALDIMNDMINTAASETINSYKQVVASTYFNEPVEPLEVEQ